MPALTVAQLVKDLEGLIGIREILQTDQRENVYLALQYALNLIDTNREWRWQRTTGTFDTVASQVIYDLAAEALLPDLGEIKSLWTENPFQRIRKRTHRFYINHLVDAVGSDPATYYWLDGGTRRIRLWYTPATAYTVQCLYRRYHGDVRANCTIHVPSEYRMVIAHLAKQCFNGQINSLEKMLDADPYIRAMWIQMRANETSTDDTQDEDEPGGLALDFEEIIAP